MSILYAGCVVLNGVKSPIACSFGMHGGIYYLVNLLINIIINSLFDISNNE